MASNKVGRTVAEDRKEGLLIVKSVATIVRGPSDRTETLGSEVSALWKT